ncbi:MAG: hypothetical protein KC613_16140 [Myxococcales bacterium]|nr:hypothetical protein [Myxococcales bacterium]MCB9526622.1 hypothetical protein [Myxococcales bacterium]
MACDDDPSPPPAAPDGGADTPCGRGPAQVSLGVGQPYQPNPDQVFQTERGLQGGVHVDVSLRVQGSLDPDSVDVQIRLWDGDTLRGRHDTADWFFFIDEAAVACDYPKARLVLEDGADGALPPDRVAEVTDRPLTLEVRLSSPAGQAEHRAQVTLRAP